MQRVLLEKEDVVDVDASGLVDIVNNIGIVSQSYRRHSLYEGNNETLS